MYRLNASTDHDGGGGSLPFLDGIRGSGRMLSLQDLRIGSTGGVGRHLPLVAGFILLLVIAAASMWLVSSSRQHSDLVLHSQEVQAKTYRLLALVEDAETGQRGYLLTGNEVYLDRHMVGSAAPTAIAELMSLTQDNEVQQRELGKLRSLVSAKLDETTQTVQLRRSGNASAALEIVNTNFGRDLMQQIRASIDRVLSEEDRLLNQRIAAADASEAWLLGVNLGGVALVIALAVLSIIGVRRHTTALLAAQAALHMTNDNLEAMVDARTIGLREANDEIQRFAYIVSHDLRAPLVNIMGFTSELETVRSETARRLAAAAAPDEAARAEDERIDADFVEALGFIKASTTKMDGLINAILKLSREGRRSFRPEKLDMEAMATAIADSLRHQCVEQGAVIEIEPHLPDIVADRVAVEQILTNLVENAVKYLVADRPGQIEIAGHASGSGMVAYEVRDNGRGIEAHDNERIFELFRRAGAQDRPGEGIGLAHVRALVRRLGGSIVCQSTAGKGSIFRLTLPKVARVELSTEDAAA
jgi:signal transduction histidine kinase